MVEENENSHMDNDDNIENEQGIEMSDESSENSPIAQEINQESHESESVASTELKKSRKKALLEFRGKLEDAIIGNYILGKPPTNLLARKTKMQIREISLWGVPLLPSKSHQGTDVVLLKFLKARDFKVDEAFEMLQKTLRWRRKFKADGILEEKLGSGIENSVYINSTDKEGRPLCFVVYGDFKDREMYKKAFGTEEKCEEFLRWRVQFMEKVIEKLNFKAGGINSIVQITDLKNSPSTGMKELRSTSKKAVVLLQENYPQIIHRNIILNVPFWYYASHMLLTKLISQRTKRKFVFGRPSNATETLLKYIAPENLPVQYGGLNREDDHDFSTADKVSELIVKGNTAGSLQIPLPEAGVTSVWDITVVGWEVSYKEEFIPDDEGSYTVLLQNEKKMSMSVRNSFYISEPGKIVITIENATYKKKRVFYRTKLKTTLPMYIHHQK